MISRYGTLMITFASRKSLTATDLTYNHTFRLSTILPPRPNPEVFMAVNVSIPPDPEAAVQVRQPLGLLTFYLYRIRC